MKQSVDVFPVKITSRAYFTICKSHLSSPKKLKLESKNIFMIADQFSMYQMLAKYISL
jgi:hypothetical protein